MDFCYLVDGVFNKSHTVFENCGRFLNGHLGCLQKYE